MCICQPSGLHQGVPCLQEGRGIAGSAGCRSEGKFGHGSDGGINKVLRDGEFKLRHYRMKPRLTQEHMKRRLEFAQLHKDIDVLDPVLIHVDEKWWFAAESTGLILPVGDDTPIWSVQSRRFVKKTMALVAVGPPVFDEDGNVIASGKVIFVPCTRPTHAKRSSKSHDRGDIILRAAQCGC